MNKKKRSVYPMTGRGKHVELKWETDGLYRRWRLGLEKKASYPPIADFDFCMKVVYP